MSIASSIASEFGRDSYSERRGKKEGNSDIHYNMEEPQKHRALNEQSMSRKGKQNSMIPLLCGTFSSQT